MATERAIVTQLIAHLQARGFRAVAVDNGEEVIWSNTQSALLDDVFSVDESNLMFRRGPNGRCHAVFLVCGNGDDIISDWGMDRVDSPWNAAIESFNHN